ncbi:hypothetical protein U3516DRAFT_481169, partial [Neocallimastix sp. 'constans']
KDTLLEIHTRKQLTSERLKFILKNDYDDLKVSSILIKQLIKDNNVQLLDVIFNNLKYYDNSFILNLLTHYKDKRPLSESVLKNLMSNERYKI